MHDGFLKEGAKKVLLTDRLRGGGLRSHKFGVLLGIDTLLCEPPKIQIYTVSQSEGKEAINAIRRKRIE